MKSALSPVWNQVIKIKQIVFMSQHRLLESPPIVFVEINNNELSVSMSGQALITFRTMLKIFRDYASLYRKIISYLRFLTIDPKVENYRLMC